MKWYLHRLRAMSLQEMLLHARKKLRQRGDASPPSAFEFRAEKAAAAFPIIPTIGPERAVSNPLSPSEGERARVSGEARPFQPALAAEVANIKRGQITAFGTLPLHIDLPPRWHKDALAGVDLQTDKSAFKLNHRALPNGADIKLVWELSRFNFLVRLAQAAALLDDKEAGAICVRCLGDWHQHNPPFTGWNWTSALESGLRLIQLVWIDRLLERAATPNFAPSIERMLGAHTHFTWRYCTFGSSANNHLIGELVGLILAVARWPDLARFAAPLSLLQALWEREVLAQFAEDGGNKEQALNYHLFSFEFCWQARLALSAAGHKIIPAVEERLRLAGDFFRAVQTPHEPWDYGDSDSASVTPLFANQNRVTQEWLAWLKNEPEGQSIHWWLGPPPEPLPLSTATRAESSPFLFFPGTGIAIAEQSKLRVRWDLSPLGYLSTAAHGHLDALHVTLWFQNKAFIIDPGTGAYYGNKEVRQRLADWRAHNGPIPNWGVWPNRMGPFLWKEHHAAPKFDGQTARLHWPQGVAKRAVAFAKDGLDVDDSVEGPTHAFEVNWHFAPETIVTEISKRSFKAERDGVSLFIKLDPAWDTVRLLSPPAKPPAWEALDGQPRPEDEDWKRTLCSPAFRQLAYAPKLVLTCAGLKPCVLRTSFLTSLR